MNTKKELDYRNSRKGAFFITVNGLLGISNFILPSSLAIFLIRNNSVLGISRLRGITLYALAQAIYGQIEKLLGGKQEKKIKARLEVSSQIILLQIQLDEMSGFFVGRHRNKNVATRFTVFFPQRILRSEVFIISVL